MADFGFDASDTETQDGNRVQYQIGNKDYGSSAALRADPPAHSDLPGDLKATDDPPESLAGRP